MTIVNDREWKFLSEQTGMSAPFNDMYFYYLRDLGYTGTLQDMIVAYGYGFTPSKGGVIPPEPVIKNGGFDTDTDWTKGGGWTIVGGIAVGVPNASITSLSQPADLIAGQWKIDFDIVSRSAGSVAVRFEGGTPVQGVNKNTIGLQSDTLVSTGNTTFIIIKSTTFNGSIDNVVATYLGSV